MTQRTYSKQLKVALLLSFLLVPTQSGFAITGNDWNRLSKDQQDIYILGVIDGFNNAVSTCNDFANTDCSFVKKLSAPVSCFGGRPYSQMAAIVRKHMKDSPAIWHFDMVSTIWVALDEACKAGKGQ